MNLQKYFIPGEDVKKSFIESFHSKEKLKKVFKSGTINILRWMQRSLKTYQIFSVKIFILKLGQYNPEQPNCNKYQ